MPGVVTLNHALALLEYDIHFQIIKDPVVYFTSLLSQKAWSKLFCVLHEFITWKEPIMYVSNEKKSHRFFITSGIPVTMSFLLVFSERFLFLYIYFSTSFLKFYSSEPYMRNIKYIKNFHHLGICLIFALL